MVFHVFHRDFMVFHGDFIGISWETDGLTMSSMGFSSDLPGIFPAGRRTSAGVPAQLGKPTTVGNQPLEEGPGPGRIGGWETVKPIFLLPILI